MILTRAATHRIAVGPRRGVVALLKRLAAVNRTIGKSQFTDPTFEAGRTRWHCESKARSCKRQTKADSLRSIDHFALCRLSIDTIEIDKRLAIVIDDRIMMPSDQGLFVVVVVVKTTKQKSNVFFLPVVE